MVDLKLSTRALEIRDSITLAISARARDMRSRGVDVVSLGAGEPDFSTPDNIADAGVAAVRGGHTRYTAAAGIPELRAAAADWLRRRFGLGYSAENIVVTAGAKPALTLAMLALVEPGEPVLLPAPYWSSYPDIVRLAGGRPVDLRARPQNGFVHTGEEIAAAIAEHGCAGVLLNYPNNPSGAVPTREQVADIVAAIADAGVWLVSDEIYARLVYDGREHVSPAVFPRAFERTVVVNGGTKSHSMTGWRVSFLAGTQPVAAAVARLQSQAIGSTCTSSQHAALAMCLETDDSAFRERLAAFDERRRWLVGAVREIPDVRLDVPQGAFYGLLDVRDVCARLDIDDITFAERLLVEGRVATVPGSAFAIPGFVRLSYAAALEDLEKAVARIAEFVRNAR